MNSIALLSVTGALLLAGNYLYKLNKSQSKIVLVVTGAVEKISAQGVILLMKYNIKNPTSATMKMSPPLITLSVNGKQVATSDMQAIDIPEDARDDSGRIVIRATSETGQIHSRVMIPWIGLAMVAPDLIARFQNRDGKTKIAVKVVSQARVYTLVGNFPYEQISNLNV